MAREIRPEGGISHAPVHNDPQPFLFFFFFAVFVVKQDTSM